MNVAIRADSSILIGTGHAMRCLTLAESLKVRGHEVRFICRDLPGNLCEVISRRGFDVMKLRAPEKYGDGTDGGGYAGWLGVGWERDADETRTLLSQWTQSVDWLVEDHYALDKRWERACAPCADRIMVVDDLANREHDCDILLDQSHTLSGAAIYSGLVPDRCTVLAGASFAMLREEFLTWRRRLQPRTGALNRVLIFLGGADTANETKKVIEAIRHTDLRSVTCEVVVGRANPHLSEIRELCDARETLVFRHDVQYMAELMTRSDLAIGAAGTTTWERACLGLPGLLLSVADNQDNIGKEADTLGFARYLGRAQELSEKYLAERIQHAIADPRDLATMSEHGMELVDGMGVFRVADCLTDQMVPQEILV